MSATTNLGKVSVTPKGAWAITNAYEILDIVTSGGSSYLAKQDVPTGVPLSNTSYWIMIAEKGDGGEVTSASASISGGYGTPGVTVTAGGTAHERTLAFAFTNLRGEKGETGNGIDSVYKTGTSGLVDTYTILFTDGSTYEFEVNNGTASIDDTLTKSGWAADAKVVGDTKASIDGFYETMGVGVADNLTPYSEDSGASQDIPFIAQGTGCGNGESVVDTGSYMQAKKKLGNTVCVNQIFNETRSGTAQGVSVTVSDGAVTMTGTSTGTGNGPALAWTNFQIPTGHKVLVLADFSLPAGDMIIDQYNGYAYTSIIGKIITITAGYLIPQLRVANSGVTYNVTGRLYVIDLTLWFGSNDRIPSDLLSHPENWGRYYAGSLAYNAGTLESADGTVMKSIGRNVWDEEWVNGRWAGNNGVFNPAFSYFVASKNPIPVLPNTTYYFCIVSPLMLGREVVYYDVSDNWISDGPNMLANATFTTPSNCHYIRFNLGTAYGTTYNHDLTISLYYSGESGYSDYYPFSVLAEVDTGSEVLRSAGAVADEKTPDGTITRNVGTPVTLNLSTMTFTQEDGEETKQWYSTNQPFASYKKPATNADRANAQSSRFACMAYTDLASNSGFGITATGRLGISNDVYTNRAAYTSVEFFCEAATPTTEQGTAFPENIPCDDFGSMYWTQTKGIPQGNEIFYPVDYKASIDTLYNRVEGDMSAIVIDSQLEVVADRIPEAPSEDGTYTLKATVSSGTKTYSWVADE